MAQPGRGPEMMPHLCWRALQQPLNVPRDNPIAAAKGVVGALTSGHCGSATAGAAHSLLKLTAVLLEAHTSSPPWMMQQGTMHGFPGNWAGAWQTSPPHITGVVGAVSVQVIIIGSAVPASPAVPPRPRLAPLFNRCCRGWRGHASVPSSGSNASRPGPKGDRV